ncbi:MAG: hypothetical protein ACJA02_001160 [Myxococcota bacterium]|jgi:hypothetical protein
MKKILTITILFCLSSNASFAHGGRTDSDGCHNDRKNSEYHCHNKAEKIKNKEKS